MPEFEAVIGLETHIQLNTKSKIFCACKADSWDDSPNTNICPVCTGLPGALPALSEAVVEKAALLAAAVGAKRIQSTSYFARKNYFYPDLPKGYQISQYDEPLAYQGAFELPLPDGEDRRIEIEKLHIEEDAGKTVYGDRERWIDFNRCGVPLVEMVTGPDFRSEDEAAEYVIRLRQLIRWLGVSEGDMERGHLRVDANVSLREVGDSNLNPKTEIKNLNSIESVRSAVKAEIDRQTRSYIAGEAIETWTLHWDDQEEVLRKMRVKETEADYRYFREPDLLPVELSDETRQELLSTLPELPLERRSRFVSEYKLPAYDSEILTEERSLSEFFEAAVQDGDLEAKTVSNWVMNDLLRLLGEKGGTAMNLSLKPAQLRQIIGLVESGAITTKTGRSLLERVDQTGLDPAAIVEQEGLAQVADEDSLRPMAQAILEGNPHQVKTYRDGKESVLGWFVGQLMKETQGKANPQLARTLFEELLND